MRTEDISTRRELDELLAWAGAAGMDAGLYDLPDEFPAKLAPQLKEAAMQLFGDAAAACRTLGMRLATLSVEYAEAEYVIANYRSSRQTAVEPVHPREWWKRAATVALAFVAAALASEVLGRAILTWRLWLLLAAEAALLILNSYWILTLPGRSVVWIREYVQYRQASYRRSRRSVRIAEARIRLAEAEASRSRAEQWTADTRNAALAEYRYQRARAGFARTCAG